MKFLAGQSSHEERMRKRGREREKERKRVMYLWFRCMHSVHLPRDAVGWSVFVAFPGHTLDFVKIRNTID